MMLFSQKKNGGIKHPAGSNRSLGIQIFLSVIIICKISAGRLPQIICISMVFLLFWRRISKLSEQVQMISKGNIEYPSIISIIDSFNILEIISIVWGCYLLISYIFMHHSQLSFADSVILNMLLSQLIFLILTVIQQIFVSFFFTTCVGHGFFLFSVLPRFFAGTRTFLVSFIWFDSISTLSEFHPTTLKVLYIIFKAIFMMMWVYDLGRLLLSKDFPPEFGTKFEKNGFTCPVCLENVLFYITLPCSHHFCLQCFCKWGDIKLNCPVCRTEFSSWLHQVEFNHLIPISLMIF